MKSSLERRRGPGRRRTDAEDERRLRGLLHGQQMTTLPHLVEAVRADTPQGRDSGFRPELLAAEMSRALDLIDHGIYGLHSDHRPGEQVTAGLRPLAGQVAGRAAGRGGTMALRSSEGGGTVVRIVLPPQLSRHLAAAGASRAA